MIYLNDVQQTLSFLRGESSVPPSVATSRAEFIQRTLDEIYEANDWKFLQISQIVTLASGLATLPSNINLSHQLNVQYETTVGNPLTEVEMNEVNFNDRYKVRAGQNVFWVETQADGTYFLRTRETVPTQVRIVGYVNAPNIAGGTLGTPFPDRMTIALGANRWVTKAQNPEADISQDEDFFQNRLADNIGAHNRNTKRRGMRTIQEETGSSTGDF